MRETNDTIDGLLAEFRGYSAGMPPSYHVTMSWADFRKMLDRFDAAHRRERGNSAAMREALKHIKDRLPHMLQYMRVHWEDASAGGYFNELMLVIDAALAEPVRNCDRFANAVEAMAEMKRVHSYCAMENRRCLEDCPDCGKEWCSLAWLFAPAKESEAGK